MKILLVRLGALGDIVHAVPVAAALRRALPDATVDWLVDRRYAGVLALFPVAHEIIQIAPGREWRASLRTVRVLRARRYDVALDLQGLLKSALLARLSGAGRVVGFSPRALREPAASLFHTESIELGRQGHVIAKNVRMLHAVGVTPGAVIEMPMIEDDADAAGVVASTASDPFMVINPGAGWPNKQWSPERFGQLAATVARTHMLRSLVVWGPGEETLARAVADASEGTAAVAPRTSLPTLVAFLRKASVVVAGDTGPLHLAAAAGAPIVGIYGPTNPVRNGPWSPHDVCLSRFTECRCHHKRRCTQAVRCLDTIGVDEVAAAVSTRLTRGRQGPSRDGHADGTFVPLRRM